MRWLTRQIVNRSVRAKMRGTALVQTHVCKRTSKQEREKGRLENSARASAVQALRKARVMALHALDDPQIALGAVAEKLQRGLVGLAVVSRNGTLHAVEFDNDDTLGNPQFVSLRGCAAREKAPTGGLDRRPRLLGICG